ncbi:GNAT family N-acetyltransferase [Phenylobacterium aquaticum]|uniref:GNAT family N-acetyltransferase n=1 Tax=Phenylobacterium aquaticum TaxID=1763816 RepID=UPI001F5D45F7|nr:GNAT family N-acetyltransferase [Phenylobacterium aquaticum]
MIDLPAIEGALTALVSGSAVEELQVLLERCADFEILVTGAPPGPTAAEDLLVDAPEDHPLRDKFVIGVWTDQGLTATIDLLRHFPQEHVWYVGLLLVAPESRGQGLGRRIVEALIDWVRRQGGRALRLVVQEQNPRAMAFWRAHDFQPIGTAVQELEARTNQVTRMERRI